MYPKWTRDLVIFKTPVLHAVLMYYLAFKCLVNSEITRFALFKSTPPQLRRRPVASCWNADYYYFIYIYIFHIFQVIQREYKEYDRIFVKHTLIICQYQCASSIWHIHQSEVCLLFRAGASLGCGDHGLISYTSSICTNSDIVMIMGLCIGLTRNALQLEFPRRSC